MRTGFGEHDCSREVNSMIEIMMPVMEKTIVYAGEYAKACGRETIVSEDMQYAMKYCAMHTVGEDIGSIFPDVYQDSSSSSSSEDQEEEDPPFTRYDGTDPRFLAMNEAYDGWNTWMPQNPAEQMLKNSIDRHGQTGA